MLVLLDASRLTAVIQLLDLLASDRLCNGDAALILMALALNIGVDHRMTTGPRAIYRPGHKMAKAGVMLLELQSDSVQQQELALEDHDSVDRVNLMATLDGLNLRYGRGTVSMASAGLAGDRSVWAMKQERLTPAYTTNWNDLAVART